MSEEIKIPKKVEQIMESNDLFLDTYDAAKEKFNRASKLETLYQHVVPGMLRRNDFPINEAQSYLAQVKELMRNVNDNPNSGFYIKLFAIKFAAYDRETEIISKLEKESHKEAHKIIDSIPTIQTTSSKNNQSGIELAEALNSSLQEYNSAHGNSQTQSSRSMNKDKLEELLAKQLQDLETNKPNESPTPEM